MTVSFQGVTVNVRAVTLYNFNGELSSCKSYRFVGLTNPMVINNVVLKE